MGKKIKIAKQEKKGTKEKVWIVIALISMAVYIGWRLFFTIPDHNVYGWLATICGICLAVSETISMLEGTEHFARLGKKSEPDMPVVPFGWYPDVDILIATHNEETELLYKTVNGCRHMDYPDKSKVHIYICDDGNRPEMAELAKKMRVGYFGLADNKEAKAGNLNHAIGKTTSPWIVTFDSDMIPTHNFLMETVPYIFLPRMKKKKDGSWEERTEEALRSEFRRIASEIRGEGGIPQLNHPRDYSVSTSFNPAFYDMLDIFQTMEIWNGSHPMAGIFRRSRGAIPTIYARMIIMNCLGS